MQPEFRPIAEAFQVAFGTIADLRMSSGRTYRAVWGFRGNCCAWWPLPGQHRRAAIGLYEPVAFAIMACGLVAADNWQHAAEVNHAA